MHWYISVVLNKVFAIGKHLDMEQGERKGTRSIK